jgi:DNA-3-methyladenine glycosylase II
MTVTHRFSLSPRPPYSFPLTLGRFSRFGDEIVDRLEDGRYQRLLSVDGHLALATVTNAGTLTQPLLHVELHGPKKTDLARPEFAAQLRHILATDLDLTPFYRLARKDEILAPLVRPFRGLKPALAPSLFESLVMGVLSQQVNLTFAFSIKRELVEAFGRKWRAQGRVHWAFPEPKRFAAESAESLRRFRLSRAKAGTLVRLGQAFASGEFSQTTLAALADEELVEHLTGLKGIGRWTAEIALMRGLARPDAFPGGDLGVVKYVAQGLLGKGQKATEAEMRAFAERWRPYRGLALVYCYAELGRRLAEKS